MKLSGTKPELMLKSLSREFISLKSLVLNILQKHMCAWEVGTLVLHWARDTDNTWTDMDVPGNDCPELTEKTADSIDDDSLRGLFVSTQMNNLDLCGKAGVEWVSH